ncbi:PKD domain-containing protein [Carboxylicivirga sp. M1479]|uniref:PKD domain-containing protein n=1 Tax=Carboxylicivirga sp. M1479 TaxID=2594476 RepID=UPI0011773450|nr:PKD domain-containing protein [Carboxylicivirga sp. M1479]TRX70858.1 PKD domain-containing protein [Carboxylicivirga sp. M1479]
MGINTQALINIGLRGRIASLMLILSLLVGVEVVGQIVYTGGRASLTGLEILTAAGITGDDLTHDHDWTTIPAGLTIAEGATLRSDDDVITWSGGTGSSYVGLEWHAGGHGGVPVTIIVTNSPPVPVCQDGVVRLAKYLVDTDYVEGVDAAPPGHLQKGYWSETAGLTLTDVNDPDAIITIPASAQEGDTYTLTWFHATDQTYTVTIAVTGQVAPTVHLHNEDGNEQDVLFCSFPGGQYTFATVASSGSINIVDLFKQSEDGSTEEIIKDSNTPSDLRVNFGGDKIVSQDLFYAMVDDGQCLDITTNRIRLGELTSVDVQIQGGKSACDPTIFDGNHVLEVMPFDENNFDYQWQFNGADIPLATTSTYTLEDVANGGYGAGSYTVVVTDPTGTCGPFPTAPVVVSDTPMPSISILDKPDGSGVFGMCDDGVSQLYLETQLDAAEPANSGYAWFHNGGLLSGNSNSFLLDNDPGTDPDNTRPEYNAYGEYVVEIYDVNNPECRSTSEPMPVNVVSAPTAYSVSGSNLCKLPSSGASINIGMANSEAGVRYVLLKDGAEIEYVDRNATGSFIFPAVSDLGTYTVVARAGTCADVNMLGSVTIEQSVSPQDIMALTGNLCSNDNNIIGLAASEMGVSYSLYTGIDIASALAAGPIESIIGDASGAGGPVSFSTVLSTAGVYWVQGTRVNCSEWMNNSITIVQGPDVSGMALVGSNGCSNELKNIGLNTTELNVFYELLRDNNIAAPVSSFTGDGSGKSFFPAVQLLAPGVYTVRATNVNNCQEMVAGNITITKQPDDISFLTISPSYVCGTGTITINPGELGVRYTVYLDNGAGNNPVLPAMEQTGNGVNYITFGGLTTPGTYSVFAENSVCSRFLSDVLIVEKQPIPQTVSIPDYSYCTNETGVTVNIDGTENLINYVLVDNSGNDVLTITGDGTLRSFSNITKGTYHIEARSPNLSCIVTLKDVLNNSDYFTIQENTLPDVDILNLPDNFCEDEVNITLVGEPSNASGVWSGAGLGSFLIDNGDGTATFEPGMVGVPGTTYDLTYTYTDGSQCINSITKGATVHANSIDATTLEIVLFDDTTPNTEYCENSPSIDIKAKFKGLDQFYDYAVFSGPGVTSTGLGTASFSPADAGLGDHQITLTFQDPLTDCVGSVTLDVSVGTPISIVGLASEYCANDNTDYPLQGYIDGVLPPATVDNSSFEIVDPDGNTVGDGIVNNTQNFNPNQIVTSSNGKTGVYTVIYSYNSGSCVNELIQEINIIETPDSSFTFPTDDNGVEIDKFCANYGFVGLKPSDPNIANYSSLFTLNGSIINNGFNTTTSNLNLFPTLNTIVHRVDNNGCISTKTRTFSVNEPNVTILLPCSIYFENDDPFQVVASGLDENNGTAIFEMFASDGSSVAWLTDSDLSDNMATIDPNGHVGNNYRVVMTFKSDNTDCEKVVETSFDIYPALDFNGVFDGDKICNSSGLITLSGTSIPAGASAEFTIISGLTNTSNGVATIDPASMSIGINTLEFKLTGADGCVHTVSKQIEILDTPSAIYDIQGGGIYCKDAPLATKGRTIGLTGSSIGVTYELLINGGSLSIPVTFDGTGSSFNFTVNNDGTGGDQLFTSTGNYTVIADMGGCAAVMNGSTDIIMYELSLNLDSQTDISCFGDSDGTVTLIGGGGSGNYEYSVDGTSWQLSPTFTGLGLGDHEFSIRDISIPADKCSERIDILTVNVQQPLTALDVNLLNKTNVGCTPCTAGVDCEGSATISISGGTPDGALPDGYTIIWSTGGTGLTETGMPVGNHSVQVTDAKACTTTFGVEIIANTPIMLTEHADANLHIDNDCHNGTSGEFVVVATGGSGTFEFSLTDPATTTEVWLPATNVNEFNYTGLSAGAYNIWVRDADALYQRCIVKVDTPITISEPNILTITEEVVSHKDITCSTATDGEFTVKASGGLSGTYNFSLTDPAIGASWQAANTALLDGLYVTGVGAGVHSVWVQDAVYNSCETQKVDVTILDVNPLTYTVIDNTNVSCHLGNDGRLEVLAQGGSGNYVYQWEQPVGTIISSGPVNYIEDLLAGDYHLTIQDVTDPTNICAAVQQTFTITQPDALVINLLDIQASNCSLQNTGSIEIDVQGGTTDFVTYPGLGYDISWSNGESNKEKIENLTPGNYTVEVIDNNGCRIDNVATPYIVGALADISLESHLLTHNDCFQGSLGEIAVKVDGGSGQYEFRLQGDKIVDWQTAVPILSDEFAWSGLLAGNYEVLVRDANDNACEFSMGTFAITEGTEIIISHNPAIDVTDVTCNGGNDGAITVSTIGGSGVYHYSLDNGATWFATNQAASYTFTNINAGKYFIKVQDALSCSSSNVLEIDVDEVTPLSFALNPLVTPVSCFDGNDGSIVVSGQGGSGNYDYSIDGGANWQPTGDFNILEADTYSLSIRDRNNILCQQLNLLTITVDQPNDFTVTEDPDPTKHIDVNCFGESTGSLTVVASGGEGTFEYQLSNASGVVRAWQSLPTFSGLAAQTYNVSVRDMGTSTPDNCEKTNVLSITISEPSSLPSIDNISITNVDCFGSDSGEIEVGVSGGTAPYTYQWTRVSDNANISAAVDNNPVDLLAGIYRLVVTDNNGCVVDDLPEVKQPIAAINVSHNPTNISVVGANDGTISVNTPTNGTSPYTIVWSDGAGAFDGLWMRDNLAAGTYTYIITDSNGCTVSKDVTILETGIALSFDLVSNTINCFNDNSGVISIKVTGGTGPFDIEWDGTVHDGTVANGSKSNILTNDIISSLRAGTYTVKLKDVNGELSKVISIDQADEVSITAGVISSISCNGAGDGRIIVNVASATDPTAYEMIWSGPGGYLVSGTVAAESTQSDLSVPGDYYVTVNYNSTCAVTEKFNIKEPLALGISTDFADTKNVSCDGGNDGQIAVNVTGGSGFSYTWYEWNTSTSTFDVVAGETNRVITGLTAGLYKVEAELSSTSCTIEHEVTLTEPQALTLDLSPVHITSCFGNADGAMQLTIGGGTAPYRYNFGAGDQLMNPLDTEALKTNLLAGTHTVVVTDDKGCVVTASEDILEPNELQVTVVDYAISCETPTSGDDGYLDITIAGGYDNGGQQYRVSIENSSNELVYSDVYTNTVGVALPVNVDKLAADTYDLIVEDINSSDASNCTFTDRFTLSTIVISGSTEDATCITVNDGEINDVVITGATASYTYNWQSLDGGVGFSDATLNQAGLSVGTYRLTVTDPGRGGCVADTNFVIIPKTEIDIAASVSDVECFGDQTGAIEIDPKGRVYTYTWSGPGITASNEHSQNLSNVVAGQYELLVEDGACSFVAFYDIEEPAEIDFDLHYEITDCDDYERTIVIDNVSGGTGDIASEYAFSVSGTGTAVQDVSDKQKFIVDQGGSYTVSVFDKNACFTSRSITIPLEMNKSEVINDVVCHNGATGSINLNMSGGSGAFTYAWTNTGDATYSESTASISNLKAGEYQVLVTDVIEGCTRTWLFDVAEPQAITIGIDKGDITCNGDNNGYINVSATGGVESYTYYWSPTSGGIVQNAQNQSDLSSGSYTVTVRDNNNCSANETVVIEENDPISAVLTPTDTDCDGNNGQLELTVNGGSNNYTYNWSTVDGNHTALNNSLTTQTGLSGGTYQVTVTDADPAKSSCSITVEETLTKAIEVINKVVTPVSCSGNNDGTISFDVIGGDENYTYSWTTLIGDPTKIQDGVRNQIGLSEGKYQVDIADGRTPAGVPCSIPVIFDVVATSGLIVDVAIDNVVCKGESSGKLSVTVSGGNSNDNYTYDWNDGAYSGKNLDNLPAGPYKLLVIDNELSCEFIQTYHITEPSELVSIDLVDVTDVKCKDDASGEILISASGGTGALTYLWSGSPSIPTGNNPTGLLAGTYEVAIVDAEGCNISSGPIVINEPAQSIAIDDFTVSHTTLPLASDGSISIAVSGGVGTYHYAWFDKDDNAVGTDNTVLDGVGKGEYYVIVTDDNACSVRSGLINVVGPDASLDFDYELYHVRPCNGDGNGIIDITNIYGGHKNLATGSPTYNIKIEQGAVTHVEVDALNYTYTGVLAGTYQITITDRDGNTALKEVIVTEEPVLTIASDVISNATCYLGNNGVIEVTVDGGIPDASGNYFVEIVGDNGDYQSKSDVKANVALNFSGLAAATYSIRVSDHVKDYPGYESAPTNCFAEDIKEITQPEAQVALDVSAGSKEICWGEDANLTLAVSNWNFSDGNLAVTIFDGKNKYTDVTVSSSPFNVTVTPETRGNYEYSILKVYEPGNATCLRGFDITPVPATVIVNEPPTASISSTVTEVCQGDDVGLSVVFSSGTEWTFTWEDLNNGSSGTVTTTNNPYLFTDSPIDDARYVITSVDNTTCSSVGNGEVLVDVRDNPSVLLSGAKAICANDASGVDLQLDFTGQAPYTLVMDEDGKEVSYTFNSDSETLNVRPLTTTTYTVKSVRDANSCIVNVAGQQAIVTINHLPERIAKINVVDPQYTDGVCQGAVGVEYSVEAVNYATGGYTWIAPDNSSIVSGDGTIKVELEFDSNFAGGYLKVKGGDNGCGEGPVTKLWIPAKPLPANPSVITGPAELCEGQFGFSYSITPVANATAYRWELPTGFNIVGDTDGASIVVELDPIINSLSSTIKVIPYNNCGDALADSELGVNVYPLPVAYAGPNGNVCGSADTYTMQANNASLVNAAYSGEWEVVSGEATITDVSKYNTTVTNLSRGDVVFRWRVTNTNMGNNQCGAESFTTVRNNELSVLAQAASSTVCNSIADLTGTPIPLDIDGNVYANTSGAWKVVEPISSTAVISDGSANVTSVSNLENGRNVFSWTITQNGCSSTALVEVYNNEPSDPVITNGTLVDVCGDAVTLTAAGSVVGNGSWSLISGSGTVASSNSTTTNITGLRQGDNTFRYTIEEGGCTKSSEIVVRNNKLDVSAGADDIVCGDVYLLEATPVDPANGITGYWSSTESVFFVDGTNPSTEVRQLLPDDNTLTWTLKQNGCESSAQVVITNNQPTLAEVGANDAVCSYETELKATSFPDLARGEQAYWSVLSGAGKFEDKTKFNTKVSGLGLGENTFRWTITHEGCSSYADQTITNLHVEVNAGKDTVVCEKTVMLNGNKPVNGDIGAWSIVEGGATYEVDQNSNPSILLGNLEYGVNRFAWTIMHETCPSSDIVTVTNNKPYYIDSNQDKREVSAGSQVTVSGSEATMTADRPHEGSGFWILVSGGGNIVDPDNAGTKITNLRQGESVFRWTVTNAGCSYSSDVTVVNGAIEQANAGRNDSTCNAEILLNGNEPLVALGEWSIIEGAGSFEDENKFNTKVVGLDAGRNIFRWTLYNGASKSYDDVVIINNEVVVANAGEDGTICIDNVFALSGSIPTPNRETVKWSVIGGSGTFADENAYSTTVSGLEQGENIIKYEVDYHGCYSEDYMTIINDTPTEPFAGDNVTLCTDSIMLTPNTPTFGVGEWIRVSGHADALALDDNWAKDLAPGINKLSWQISNNGCVLSDTITIINNQPDMAVAGQDRPVCDNSVVLSANQPRAGMGIGYWQLIAGSGSIADSTNRESAVTDLGLGNNRFRWVIDNNGCLSMDEVNIAYNLVEADAGYAMVLCEDSTVLNANTAYPGVGSWGIESGSGSARFEEPNNPYTKVTGLDQGDNILTWTIDYGGCQSVSTVVITNNSPTKADAGSDQALCDVNMATLGGNIPLSGHGTGQWSIKNGTGSFDNIDVNNPTVNDIEFGDNIYRWTISNKDCKSFDDVVISNNRIESVAGELQELCASETILDGNAATPGIGTWSVIGGTSQASFEDLHNPHTTVSNLAKGTNVLRWVVAYRGCETISEVTIVNNSPSAAYAGNTQELCESEAVLDASVPSPGEGVWTVINGSGTITDLTDPKAPVTGLSKGDNVLRWTVSNGICTSVDEVRIINNEPSVPYAGIDETTCDGSISLKAEEPLVNEEHLWTIEQGYGNFDDPTSPTATISNLMPGDNILKWTITRGQCELSHSITISNNAAEISEAGPDIEDCKDWSELDANVPQDGNGIGEWSLVSGKGDFDNASDAKTTIRNLGFGENILMWTITNGDCFTSDQITIFNKIPDQSEAGDDRTICEDYITLNANDPLDGIGQWSVESGIGEFVDASKHNTQVTGIGYGTNIFKWTISYGDCTTEDVVQVTSNKASPYAGEDDVTYDNEYDMQAQNPGSLDGVWTVVSGGGTFDDPNFFNTTVRDLPAGKSTFRWSIITEGCEAYDEVTIDYLETPDAGFIVDHEVGCYPLEVKFTNYSVNGSRYIWDFGDGTESYVSDKVNGPQHVYEDPGTYTASLTVPGPGGNDAIFTQRIIVHDHPVADFNVGPELVYLPEDEIRCYDLSIDAVSWFWEFGDGQTSEEQNPSYLYTDEGTYSITLTVQNGLGCEDSFTKDNAIEAYLSGYVEFPNAFRPRPGGSGGSGTIGERNDAIFKAKNKDVEEYSIQIFNRWGQLIYESKDIEQGWDGTYKGKLVPQAVYVYKAFVRFTNGREKNKAGSVLLVR